MAYLFDTDAISELLKKTPLVAYANWVSGLRREDQFTSSVVIAELFAGPICWRRTGGLKRLGGIYGICASGSSQL